MGTPVAQPVQGPWVIAYSNAGINQSNSSFYYHDQTVHWLANYGGPLVNVTLADIDATNFYNASVALNYGVQAGGCAVMFFVVLVLSNAAKRRTPIYILNTLSLFFGFLRGLFYALYNISAWVELYPYYTDDFSAIPRSAYVTSVIATIWPLLMTVTVNLSLVLQAYTVTKSMQNSHRYTIIALSTLVFLLATGFRFAVMVSNCESIVGARVFDSVWVQKGALYMETVSIWFFSIIFTSKLVYTLYYRRKHGWKQWSGVKILAAMGGCTMLIPSLFAILEYVSTYIDVSFPESGSIALTMVALLLPLSSLWAGMAIHEETSRLDISHLSGHNMQVPSSQRSNPSKGSRGISGSNNKTTVSSVSECKCGVNVEYGEYSSTTIKNKVEGGTPPDRRDSTEMDLEAMGVRVDKSYSLQSGKECCGFE